MAGNGQREPVGGRGVLEGAFSLLEELADAGEAGLTTLAAGAGLPKATAHRLLTQLVALGAVERRAGRYLVGPQLVRLGGGAGGSQTSRTAIAAAKDCLGTPYAWGGGRATGPGPGLPPDRGIVGFDCSALMVYAYGRAGIALPRTSAQQYHAGQHFPLDQAQRGDLVFWGAGRDPAGINHVALYVGDDLVIQAPQSGDVVKISKIWTRELLGTVTRPEHALRR